MTEPQSEGSTPISRAEWLRVVESEYLNAYIREGGASVKVVVCNDELAPSVAQELQMRAGRAGYVSAFVDSRSVKAHLVQNVFGAAAASIDWRLLARRFLAARLRQAKGYRIQQDEPFTTDRLATANAVAPQIILADIRQIVTEAVYYSVDLQREMRLALLQLVMVAMDDTDQARTRESNIIAWLTADLRLVSAVRDAAIYQKVNRHNARGLLMSLGAWVRMADGAGAVLVVDIRRYLDAAADVADGHRYTPAATAEMYEVVRQFIDGTDGMVGTFIVFLTGPSFLTDLKRGMKSYDALRLRLVADVRDRARPNPLSPMVTLE